MDDVVAWIALAISTAGDDIALSFDPDIGCIEPRCCVLPENKVYGSIDIAASI